MAPSTFNLFSVLGTGDASGSHCGMWKEQAQFLAPLLCAVLSQGYRLLPLAHIIERAATGSWTAGEYLCGFSRRRWKASQGAIVAGH